MPHLIRSDGLDIRSEKLLSESEREVFLRHELVVEEKIDGANLGISFDVEGNMRAQNRGSYLTFPGSGQWKKLGEWLIPRTNALFDQLADRYILFGEWCYARHSVPYDRLPDWFLGFDLYDKRASRFLSCSRRDEFLQKMSIAQVPIIARGHFTLRDIPHLLSQSKFGSEQAEGLCFRFDQGERLVQRAKLVRPAFIQSIGQHWSQSQIQPNRLILVDGHPHLNPLPSRERTLGSRGLSREGGSGRIE